MNVITRTQLKDAIEMFEGTKKALIIGMGHFTNVSRQQIECPIKLDQEVLTNLRNVYITSLIPYLKKTKEVIQILDKNIFLHRIYLNEGKERILLPDDSVLIQSVVEVPIVLLNANTELTKMEENLGEYLQRRKLIFNR